MALLEMRGIYKSFNSITVLKGVDLTVEAGTVHALLGENGAGKSTLMNVLTGVYACDGGTVVFDGEGLVNPSIHQTEDKGIAFVHQELNLFNDLKVYENIFLGKELTTKLGLLKKKEMIEQTAQLFNKLGVDIDPNAMVSELRTSEKQLLEISKALFFDAKLLILDEPTTSLTNEDVAHLFKIVNSLKKNGTAFIFISHKMPEIFELADDYTVFRNGEYICSGKIADTDPDSITSAMVGEKYSSASFYEPREAGDVILKLNNLSGDGFKNINMEIRKGQIIGLTGLQGAGSSELMQAIFGSGKIFGGEMELFGKKISSHSIHDAMKRKIGMLAANRKENSVLPDMSILDNMSISEFTLSSAKPVVSGRKEEKAYAEQKNALNIKAQSSQDPIVSLSGGNQQKVFIARWLNTDADILLFDNPTQGIDVGAKSEIYRLVLELAKSGKTILVNTLEIPELQKVADYCAVFYEGRIVKLLEHDDIEEQTVMMYSTGAGKEDK